MGVLTYYLGFDLKIQVCDKIDLKEYKLPAGSDHPSHS